MRNRIACLALLPLLLLLQAAVVLAEDGENNGKNDFMKFCASCHGIDGKGNGSLSLQSPQKPADLTKLSRANSGQFPYVKVRAVIDGRSEKGNIRAHYNNDMPVWGKHFSSEKGTSAAANIHGDATAKMRILDIVDYLVSIQDLCKVDCDIKE